MNAEILLLIARALFGGGRGVNTQKKDYVTDLTGRSVDIHKPLRSMQVRPVERTRGELRPTIRSVGSEPISNPLRSSTTSMGPAPIMRRKAF